MYAVSILFSRANSSKGMSLRGFDPGYVRPPQRELSAAEKKRLAKELEAEGLL